MRKRRFSATIRALREGNVDFILVGGLAAVLNGAPVDTLDIDVVHSRDSTNIDRLLAALELLDAVFSIQPERRLKPSASRLDGSGHLNLITRLGPLDVLCTVGENLAYEDLLPRSHDVELAGGLRVRVLDLETLIAIKESV